MGRCRTLDRGQTNQPIALRRNLAGASRAESSGDSTLGQRTHLPPGAGLLGHVWTKREPQGASDVARELHDSVNQLLASIRFRLQSIEVKIASRDTELWREAVKPKELLENALQEVRRISRNLRPTELDDLGLVPAIRSACEEFQERTGFDLKLTCSQLAPVSGAIELTLYRILQEALSNVEKHSGAGHVRVRLSKNGSLIELKINDDGQGFNPLDKGGRKGFGLVSMRERAMFVGGALRVTSMPQRGCEVAVQIPVDAFSKTTTKLDDVS